jgi:hypothetical protein
MLIKKRRSGVIRKVPCFEVKYVLCLTLSASFWIMT